METGILNRSRRKWLSPKKIETNAEKMQPINYQQIFGILSILFLSALASLCIFFLEVVWHKKRQIEIQ